MKKFIGGILIFLGLIILLFVLYRNTKLSSTTRTFSSYTLLTSSWEKYKEKFINSDGRVIDPSQNNITTSEGQSYALLRSVWIDDKPTFDKVWKWTSQNMKRPNDNLFGWRWGQRGDKTYGFLENGGENPASDADQDIALALIFASRRWHEAEYKSKALVILKDIWETETAVSDDKRYLLAGNWAKSGSELTINPSYFAPYAWREFAKEDKEHQWESLISPAYELLEKSGEEKLDKGIGVGFPPDWVVLNTSTNSLQVSSNSSLKTNYSYDAMRIPWRIALDYQFSNDQRAKAYLTDAFSLFSDIYRQKKSLSATYSHDGMPIDTYEHPVMYATALGYFMVGNSDQAKDIYERKILRLYSTDQNTFDSKLGYYEQNWLWFGTALYSKFLTNFSEKS